MTSDKLAALFDKMDFFALEEADGSAGYCYEPQEEEVYLIATDENGDAPKEDGSVIVACYSPADSFLWKVEFPNFGALCAFYQKAGGAGFIDKLAALERAANPPG
jgi:hypothetical protein